MSPVAWVLVGLVAWALLAICIGPVIGRAIRGPRTFSDYGRKRVGLQSALTAAARDSVTPESPGQVMGPPIGRRRERSSDRKRWDAIAEQCEHERQQRRKAA